MTHEPHEHLDRLIDQATGDAPVSGTAPTAEERAAAALHIALAPSETMPAAVRGRVLNLAEALARHGGAGEPRKFRRVPWAMAATVAVASGVIGIVAWNYARERGRELSTIRDQLASMNQQIKSNEDVLAEARRHADTLARQLAEKSSLATAQETALASAAQEQTALAARLSEAAAGLLARDTQLAELQNRERVIAKELNDARLTIARYETPVDPAVLAQNRTKLLEVPDTIRIAWTPFDLPEAPAEQRVVQGDVTWNDRLQTGYLRFVGLKVNDPKVEQYQVWVIDERGMEQKVSGGVFNATAQGEVIVPIEPGINVGRVALFAITVERPGGTWVPDLKRRVVVAPRG